MTTKPETLSRLIERLPLLAAIGALIAGPPAAGAAATERATAPPPSVQSPCACAADKTCWNLVLTAFGQISGFAKTEVEASVPGQFFAGTRASALRRAAPDGHFLRVTCGPSRADCAGDRDKLEERLAVSSLLRSLPLHVAEKELFDAKSWEITARGNGILKETLRCRPRLWAELSPILLTTADP